MELKVAHGCFGLLSASKTDHGHEAVFLSYLGVGKQGQQISDVWQAKALFVFSLSSAGNWGGCYSSWLEAYSDHLTWDSMCHYAWFDVMLGDWPKSFLHSRFFTSWATPRPGSMLLNSAVPVISPTYAYSFGYCNESPWTLAVLQTRSSEPFC